MVTERQKNAVAFCEEVLGIKFRGNKNSFQEVNNYLANHLDDAKWEMRERACEYESYIWDLD